MYTSSNIEKRGEVGPHTRRCVRLNVACFFEMTFPVV
jgi:hypothetical protein